MRRYILKRHIDRFAPGADITKAYPLEDLERWAKEGIVRAVEAEDLPVALDDLAPTAEESVTAPVGEPAEPKPTRKRK